MQKAIELAKKISKDLETDWLPSLEDHNLHFTFGAIYSIPQIDIEDKNRIVCFIVYAYSPDSLWLDLKKDRLDNKKKILESLGANSKLEIYNQLLENGNDRIGMCIFNYLEELKDSRWREIFANLDYASTMMRFASKKTESEISWDQMNKEGNKETLTQDIDTDKLVKINKDKGILLDLASDKREKAEKLIEQIKKDYVATDASVQSDFNFSFTDTAKKKDILSWRQFISERNERKKTVETAL